MPLPTWATSRTTMQRTVSFFCTAYTVVLFVNAMNSLYIYCLFTIGNDDIKERVSNRSLPFHYGSPLAGGGLFLYF